VPQRARAAFITGTDTGVGKTVVTALLAVALRRAGLTVGVLKPAETGCLQPDGHLIPQDATFLRDAAACEAPIEIVCPYQLRAPLTPALAAEHEGVTIDVEDIRASFTRLARDHDVVLVEGAGGLLSPVTAEYAALDLAEILDTPLLVVAANRLGVINHAALTVSEIRRRGVPLRGLILNQVTSRDDLATDSNAAALRRWVDAPLLATIPYLEQRTVPALRDLEAELHLNPILDAL
jgi:dethiobiotin synthetase